MGGWGGRGRLGRRVTRRVWCMPRCRRGAFNPRAAGRGKNHNIVSRPRAAPWAPRARAWRHTPAHTIHSGSGDHASGHARDAPCTCARTSAHAHKDTHVRGHPPGAVRGVPAIQAHPACLPVPFPVLSVGARPPVTPVSPAVPYATPSCSLPLHSCNVGIWTSTTLRFIAQFRFPAPSIATRV